MTLLGDPQADVVVMMKIDTEGAEFGIMRALLPAMRDGRILNILVEINKGVTELDGKIHWPEWRHKGACAGRGRVADSWWYSWGSLVRKGERVTDWALAFLFTPPVFFLAPTPLQPFRDCRYAGAGDRAGHDDPVRPVRQVLCDVD